MSTLSLIEQYQSAVSKGLIRKDAHQLAAVEQLGYLSALLEKKQKARWVSWSGLLGIKNKYIPGLYIWGGVGRGKSFLMDLFFEHIQIQAKERWHFHRFMQWLHGQLPLYTGQKDPLLKLAKALSKKIRLLCFDEFFVTDVGDALLLGTLLQALFAEGVVLVATSNVPPSDLYKDGLQRDLFMPAIKALETHTQVLHVDSAIDYRLQFLKKNLLYFCPIDHETEAAFSHLFDHLAYGKGVDTRSIIINGRTIPTQGQAAQVIWFDFKALCEGPRSEADYIALAQQFPTILLSKVPIFTLETEEAAKRFIHLIDELYDRKVKLMVSAEVPIEALYTGSRLIFEFKRTQSRLIEMQSAEYLLMAHKP